MVLALGLATALVVYNLATNLRRPSEAAYLLRNLVVAALLVGVARWTGTSWAQLGLDPGDVGRGLRWGWFAVLAVAVGVATAGAVADRVPALARRLSDRRAELAPPRLAYHVFVRIPLGTAAFEEVAFRGVLLGVLLTASPTGWAVLASSIAFGLWHIGPTRLTLRINGVDDPAVRRREVVVAVVATTVAGVALCLLRLGSGSVLAPVVAHAAVNAFGLLAAALFQRTGGASRTTAR